MWLVNLGKLGHAAMCTGKLGLRLAGLPHQGDGLGLAVACQVREAAAAVASQHGDLLLALWWCRWLMWRLEVVRTCLATDGAGGGEARPSLRELAVHAEALVGLRALLLPCGECCAAAGARASRPMAWWWNTLWTMMIHGPVPRDCDVC